MLFERINASGVGMTIGSIGCDVVNNITFRDIYMHHTFKGMGSICSVLVSLNVKIQTNPSAQGRHLEANSFDILQWVPASIPIHGSVAIS